VLAALAAWVVWPAPVHPTTTVTAPLGYDVSSSIGKFGAIAREGRTPFEGGRLESVAWPDGVAMTPGLDLAQFLSSGPLWLASAAVGPVAAHNGLAFLGLLLSGAVALALVRSLSGSTWAGLVAGVALLLAPHMQLTVRAAPTYTHMWLFLLPLWAAVALVRAPGRRTALLAGAAVLPALFWTPYYTLHVLVEALALGVVAAVLIGRRHGRARALRALGLTALPVLAGLVAYLLIGLATSFADAPERAAGDAYAQSAHPLMYLVPGYPGLFWGDAPNEALAEVVPRARFTNLYLGLSVLALAALAPVGVLRARRRGGRPRDAAPVALAAGAALLAAAWSLPPTLDLAGLSVPTPAELTTTLVPGLRAGQRFVMPVLALVAVLAGLGTARLLAGRASRTAAALAVALVAVVAADLAVDPAGRTTRVPRSEALAALRAAPWGPAIHYQRPDDGTTLLVGAVARPCVLQAQHRQPLLNACNLVVPPTTPARLVALDDPADCANVAELWREGARYVIADAGVAPFPGCVGTEVLARDDRHTVLRIRG